MHDPKEKPRVWVQIIPREKMTKFKNSPRWRLGFNISHKKTRSHKEAYISLDELKDLEASKDRTIRHHESTIRSLQTMVEELRKERDEQSASRAFWNERADEVNDHNLTMENLLDSAIEFLELVRGKSIFYPFRAAFRDAAGQMSDELKKAKKQ